MALVARTCDSSSSYLWAVLDLPARLVPPLSDTRVYLETWYGGKRVPAGHKPLLGWFSSANRGRDVWRGGRQKGAVSILSVFDLAVLDAHTHLAGSDSGESPTDILECLRECGVAKAFVFAPLLNVRSWQLTDQHLDDIRAHNDYSADICSSDPERLLGFSVLNPSPGIGGGSIERAVDLMIEEARRCYHDLGLRGVKMVPTHWYPNDPHLVPLYEVIVELGMYTVFHSGIFLDGNEGIYCRPAFFEGVHQASGFKATLAHVGWPWQDECLAVLDMETFLFGPDPKDWALVADLSFGSPADWQLETWQKATTTLPPASLCYGSDVFWPCSADKYREEYLQPQLGLFETATTLGHVAGEGSIERQEFRRMIFHDNIYRRWQSVVREPQNPRPASRPISTPRALKGETN